MDFILGRIMIIPGIIIGLSLHEFAHAWMSHRLGDPTPAAQGRVTVNPFAHMDPVGFILLMILGFGWGKPVQVNPSYYKHRRLGEAAVSVAGVTMNLIIATAGMGILRLISLTSASGAIMDIIIQIMVGLVQINLVLMFFNLIPLPPLDGFGLITQIFNLERKSWYYRFYQLGPMFLMLMIVFHITSKIITPPVNLVYGLLVNLFF